MLKEICTALIEADVNIKLVGRLRQNVRYYHTHTCTHIQHVASVYMYMHCANFPVHMYMNFSTACVYTV